MPRLLHVRILPVLVGLALAGATLVTATPARPMPPSHRAAASTAIANGTPRTTVDGNLIDAHDGEIAEFGGTYYLYGTAYACGFQWTVASSPFCGFNVYSSPDLVQWTGPTQLFPATADWQDLCMHEPTPGWGCFRPHVVFDAATQLYVLWVNVPGGYRALTASAPAGPFGSVHTPQLTGGDMSVFADADGSGYVVHSSGGRIFENGLTPDYLDVDPSTATEITGLPQRAPLGGAEAPSLFARNGQYFLTLSLPQCPYCDGTGTGYLTAATAMGPWYYQGLISDFSCNGQPAAVSQLDAGYLFQADQWLQTPNEAAAGQFWGFLGFDGARILPVTCAVGPHPFAAYFTWYDRSDPLVGADNLHVVNPAQSGPPVTGAVAVGGQMLRFTIPPGGEWYGSFRPGTIGGPVQLAASARVIATERVEYGASFNEVPALSASAAASDLYFSWFDRVSSPSFRADNVHVVNPSPADAAVTVTIPGLPGCTPAATVPAGGEAVFTCPTGFGGPVHVHSNVPVVASQRVLYGQTFNEVGAQAAGTSTTLVSAWYDHASSPSFLADNVHVIAPGGGLAGAGVKVTIPGCPSVSRWPYSDTEWIYSCPAGQGFGGPVSVSASVPILVSQRVQFGASFNEVIAQDAAGAATALELPWYDLASSPSFVADNVHVYSPAGPIAPSGVAVSIPGCTPTALQMSPSELVYSCPRGQGFGGPVVIRSTVPVLAGQRVQYGQSFNEENAGA